ncbi:MAG: site-specific integrase [Actinomycetota bacterium]|nr:site-specific integrase [Actinomycetota bacterium]
MTALAPTLEGFFTERLLNQRQASPHTVDAYSTTFRLLLRFVQQRTGKAPSALDFEDLDSSIIGAFLDHLEHERHNSVRTRNSRLAAVHSLFRFAALHHPEHAALIQRVLAIPTKRYDRADVSFLGREEVDALLATPDRARWIGRRDHALLVTVVQTGLRVSELTGLCCGDVNLAKGAHIRCLGKGRKERCTPLTTQTVAVLGVWLQERRGEPGDPLFSTSRGRRLSSDAVALLVAKYAKAAQQRCPTLKNKTVSPHVLRHSAAMSLLHAGVDITVIAMWLGHESIETTQVYVHADLAIKERALARTTPLGTASGRYQAPDALLAFLEAL